MRSWTAPAAPAARPHRPRLPPGPGGPPGRPSRWAGGSRGLWKGGNGEGRASVDTRARVRGSGRRNKGRGGSEKAGRGGVCVLMGAARMPRWTAYTSACVCAGSPGGAGSHTHRTHRGGVHRQKKTRPPCRGGMCKERKQHPITQTPSFYLPSQDAVDRAFSGRARRPRGKAGDGAPRCRPGQAALAAVAPAAFLLVDGSPLAGPAGRGRPARRGRPVSTGWAAHPPPWGCRARMDDEVDAGRVAFLARPRLSSFLTIMARTFHFFIFWDLLSPARPRPRCHTRPQTSGKARCRPRYHTCLRLAGR